MDDGSRKAPYHRLPIINVADKNHISIQSHQCIELILKDFLGAIVITPLGHLARWEAHSGAASLIQQPVPVPPENRQQ